MKTEMKTFHMAVRKVSYSKTDIVIESRKPEGDEYFLYGYLGTIEIAIPVMTDEEIDKLMAGAELECLHAQREKVQAETHRKLMQIDERIGQLTAIEDKG